MPFAPLLWSLYHSQMPLPFNALRLETLPQLQLSKQLPGHPDAVVVFGCVRKRDAQ